MCKIPYFQLPGLLAPSFRPVVRSIDVAPAALALQRQVARRIEARLRLPCRLLAELSRGKLGVFPHGPFAKRL